MQSVGLRGKYEEVKLGMENSTYSSCLASAVTLSSGDVVLTGGRNQAREAFMIFGEEFETWKKLSKMSKPRYGHASCRLVVEGEERVVVAGGWDLRGRAQASVEMYSVSQERWRGLQNMPSPRVYFTLEVFWRATSSQIS